MKLHELTGNLIQLQQMVEDAEDRAEMLEILGDTIEATEEAIGESMEGLIAIWREREATAESYKREEQFFKERRLKEEMKVETIKNFISDTLHKIGYDHKNKKKVETKFGKIGFQKNPPSIEIVDPDKIPMLYHKIVEPQFDTKALLDDIKAEIGKDKLKEISEADFTEEYGVKLVNDEAHLRIR